MMNPVAFAVLVGEIGLPDLRELPNFFHIHVFLPFVPAKAWDSGLLYGLFLYNICSISNHQELFRKYSPSPGVHSLHIDNIEQLPLFVVALALLVYRMLGDLWIVSSDCVHVDPSFCLSIEVRFELAVMMIVVKNCSKLRIVVFAVAGSAGIVAVVPSAVDSDFDPFVVVVVGKFVAAVENL